MASSMVLLEHISMQRCELNCIQSVESIGSLLKTSTHLQHLDVHGNGMGPDHAVVLSQGLVSCSTLRSLCISSNPLGPRGVRHVAVALPSSLITCDLSDTGAGDEGIHALADAIGDGVASNIEEMSLCDCGTSASAVTHLLESLAARESDAMVSLDIGGNQLGGEESKSMWSLIVSSKYLISIRLHNCNIGSDIEYLTQRILEGTYVHKLVDIDISGNHIPKAAMVAFLKALASHTEFWPDLQSIVIAANPGMDDIADAVEEFQQQRPNVVVIRTATDTGEHT